MSGAVGGASRIQGRMDTSLPTPPPSCGPPPGGLLGRGAVAHWIEILTGKGDRAGL